MDDRELLELAAKAAGYKIKASAQAQRDHLINPETASLWIVDVSTAWNPLTNDGDALRLTVKLHLMVEVMNDRTVVWVAESAPNHFDLDDTQMHEGDSLSATRRAITRIAAAIGATAQGGGR